MSEQKKRMSDDSATNTQMDESYHPMAKGGIVVPDFSQLIGKVKSTPKKAAPAPQEEAPAQEAPQKAHPDQLMSNTGLPFPDLSLEGDEPSINIWFNSGNMWVCYIDGALIKSKCHNDFTEGGHFFRWGFIPPFMIWIEDILSRIDQCSTLIHEAHEYPRMAAGQSYEEAHDSASKTERVFRDILLEKGTILPSDEEMRQFVTLELQGASCLEMAKQIMENADNPVVKWVEGQP
jgi:hypothetical protein